MDASHADWIDAFDERAAILEVDAALARTTAEIEAVTDTTRLIVAAHDLDPYWHGVVDGWIRTGLPPAWIIGALILQARAPKAD